MAAVKITLLVGSYAQKNALGSGVMTARVRNFRAYLPTYFPLPHPSWRSRIWMLKNPWFESVVISELLSHRSEERPVGKMRVMPSRTRWVSDTNQTQKMKFGTGI